MTFPIYIYVGPWRIHPHLFFETLAYLLAFQFYLALRRRFGDPLSDSLRWSIIAAAAAGGAIGSKLLFWLEDPGLTVHNLQNAVFLMGGKTIVGGLLGGLIAVELVKRCLGEHQSTGDVFAVPLAVGIAIGRVGCFFTGLGDNTFGTATSLPWGVDFGDGLRRHPTQLYEIIFLIGLAFLLSRLLRTRAQEGARASWRALPFAARLDSGDIFKVFMTSYFLFRLFCDAIKPYPRVALGLGVIQWACLLGLAYYSRDIVRWMRLSPLLSPATRRDSPREAA